MTQTGHAAYESAKGVKVAMLEMSWAAYEPGDGQFDSAYASSMKAQLALYQSAGMRVTLGLGIHYTPAWIFNLPNSSYVDQHGNVARKANFVFNQQVRDRLAAYIGQVNRDIGLKNLWAIRINNTGEMLFPGSGSYFAFDQNAQNGGHLPPSMARNPFPGWHPGTSGLSVSQVDQWAHWYVGALDNAADWQMALMRSLGFPGWFQILTPGSGIRPNGWANAVSHNLPDGLIGVGAAWDVFYAGLAANRDVVVYVSSVADGSGSNDLCQASDIDVAINDPAANSWSAVRWQARIARAYGLHVGGENPGFGDAPLSYYTALTFSGLLATSLRQTVSCKLQVFYWAHDDQLWNGALPFDAFVNQVAVITGGNPAPPAMAS